MLSKRQLQVAKIIQQNMGEVFQREGRNIFGRAMVTVTSVWVSPDLGIARIYLSVFNAENKKGVLAMIEQNSYTVKKELVRRIRNKMRKMPELEFFLDETLDEVFKMETLFANLDKGTSMEKGKNEEE